ncbi:MAG: hypothetical protein HYV14_16550 [Elusimicrobia bacterium]|nr:hypothetical protein [Elusimicrobiota bacterium]
MVRAASIMLILSAGLAAENTPATPPYSSDPRLVRSWNSSLDLAPAPFWARYDDGRAALSFVAARHGEDSSTFRLIEEELAAQSPAVLILEGVRPGSRRPPSGGESAHAARLAEAQGVRWLGGEPAAAKELQGVLAEDCHARRKCTMRDFQGFYILRTWFLDAARPEGRRTIGEIVSAFSREFGVAPRLLMSDPEFEAWYSAGNGKAFTGEPDFDEILPQPDSPLLSRRVADKDSLVRNRVLAALIAEQLSRAKRILVVYGASHHAELRPVLEAMLGPAVCAGDAQADRSRCPPSGGTRKTDRIGTTPREKQD